MILSSKSARILEALCLVDASVSSAGFMLCKPSWKIYEYYISRNDSAAEHSQKAR